MSKTFNISTNLTNGAGLQRDYELIRRMLESYGHTVNGLMFNSYMPTPAADVTICLEVINDKHLQWDPNHKRIPTGKENWFVPNSEWYYPCWNGVMPRFAKILCKTPDCYEIWKKKVGADKCVYIGFESLDFYQPDLPRSHSFLHMAGKSETKNTQAVCDAWKLFSLPFPLTVVAFKPEIVKHTHGVPNCRWVERLTDAEVAHEMNSHLFHIMPSKYEGFGHYIHEAIGCGGLVLTTDAAPMNQFNGIPRDLLIPVVKKERRLEAYFNLVSPEGVANAVKRAALVYEDVLAVRLISSTARQAFLEDREYFRTKFREIANA